MQYLIINVKIFFICVRKLSIFDMKLGNILRFNYI